MSGRTIVPWHPIHDLTTYDRFEDSDVTVDPQQGLVTIVRTR